MLSQLFWFLGNNYKLCVAVVGLFLLWYTGAGSGEITGENVLRPAIKELKVEVTRRYCPDRMDELQSKEDIYDMLDGIIAKKQISPAALETGRSKLYTANEIRKIMDDLPLRCAYVRKISTT